ncbi:hypothetical protein LINGRAHAP2_LOCUS24408, partial [Linum grandiflorum]
TAFCSEAVINFVVIDKDPLPNFKDIFLYSKLVSLNIKYCKL